MNVTMCIHMNYFRLFVILMFCYYITSKMLNYYYYYSPFQSKQKNQQVNKVLFTPERYVGISVKIFYVCVSVHRNSILYKEPTRCNFGSVVY
jgi:hypothetical protein